MMIVALANSAHACISFDDDISPSNELGTVMVNLVDLDER